MAIIDNCLCCSLAIAAGFLAVFLLVAYLIAFAFEMLWILESSIPLPTAAILLCAGYFTLALFAALLIHGLATKNMFCMVSWMLSISILTFPEAGLVIYMSIQYWRIESLYGMTELACWVARIVTNVIAIVVVQSLYSIWKEEELVNKRLHDLSIVTAQLPRECSMNSLNSQYYQNNAFNGSLDQLSPNLKRAVSTPQLWTGSPNNVGFPIDAYQFYTQSEFNASIFVPTVTSNELQLDSSMKKCQSLMDLRTLEDNPLTQEKSWLPWMAQTVTQTQTNGTIYPNYGLSLDRKCHAKIHKFASLDDLNELNANCGLDGGGVIDSGIGGGLIKNRTGFYAQPIANYGVPIYYGPLDGPDFLIYKKQIDKMSSKNSLSNTSTEDVQKYRDVAL